MPDNVCAMPKNLVALMTIAMALAGCGGGPSTSTPSRFCHSIVAIGLFADCHVNPNIAQTCPTHANEFCDTSPIVATSSAQAQLACNTCFGTDACVSGTTLDGANDWEEAPFNSNSTSLLSGTFEYTGGRAGAITAGGCVAGRWAP
jgi:hypothetical protein